MQIEFLDAAPAYKGGDIVYAYFEHDRVGLVFMDGQAGVDLGGYPDEDMPELIWFDILDGRLFVRERQAIRWRFCE